MITEKIVVTPSKFNSIVTIVGVVLVIVLLIAGYFAWKGFSEENARLRNEMVEFKELTKTLIRSSTKWATKKDLTTKMKGLLGKDDFEALKTDMNNLESRLTAVGKTAGSIQRRISKPETSDREGSENQVVKCNDGELVDVHKYTKKQQIKEIKDSNTAPVAEVTFDASKKRPWKYKMYKRGYRLVTVVGKKEDGQLTFHHKLTYLVPEKNSKEIYNIRLSASDYIQVPLKSRMFWFNPILDLNFFAGGTVYDLMDSNDRVLVGADTGLSLSSYGEVKTDSWFRLFRFGVGYNAQRRTAHFSFAPFAFNIGKPLPLLTNLYLTPQVGIGSDGGLSVSLGIGPQF